jgi:hypothetical protein
VASNDSNCGQYGKQCNPGNSCISGQCVCPQAGQVSCGFAGCVDLTNDANHCGNCQNQCEFGQSCVAGVCQCPVGNTNCQGLCVNTASDPQACGTCQKQCAAGDTCANGQCACAGTLCQQDQVCADTAHDPLDCGQCGNTCQSRELCSGSKCACRPGSTLYNGQCTELSESFNNCGACGNNCGDKGLQSPRCVDGTCQDTTCQQLGRVTCNGACLSNAQLASDPRNCGQCGNGCQVDEVCAQGGCQSYFTTPACNSCRARPAALARLLLLPRRDAHLPGLRAGEHLPGAAAPSENTTRLCGPGARHLRRVPSYDCERRHAEAAQIVRAFG